MQTKRGSEQSIPSTVSVRSPVRPRPTAFVVSLPLVGIFFAAAYCSDLGAAWEAGLVANVSSNVRATNPVPAMGLEATVGNCALLPLCMRLYSRLDRTLDDDPQWQLPLTTLAVQREWPVPRPTFGFVSAVSPRWLVRAGVSASAIELHRWQHDGGMMRFGPGGEIEWEFADGWFLDGRAGVFGQANSFSQRTDGRALPNFGVQERITLRFERWNWRASVRALVEQQVTADWTNWYSLAEMISYAVDRKLYLGLGHALLSNTVDPSTGRLNPIRWSDDDESRFFVFLEYAL